MRHFIKHADFFARVWIRYLLRCRRMLRAQCRQNHTYKLKSRYEKLMVSAESRWKEAISFYDEKVSTEVCQSLCGIPA